MRSVMLAHAEIHALRGMNVQPAKKSSSICLSGTVMQCNTALKLRVTSVHGATKSM